MPLSIEIQGVGTMVVSEEQN